MDYIRIDKDTIKTVDTEESEIKLSELLKQKEELEKFLVEEKAKIDKQYGLDKLNEQIALFDEVT